MRFQNTSWFQNELGFGFRKVNRNWFQCVVSVSMCGFGFNVRFRFRYVVSVSMCGFGFRFQCVVSVSMCGVGYVLGGNG